MRSRISGSLGDHLEYEIVEHATLDRIYCLMHIAQAHFKSLLDLSALFLAIVNGLFLLKFYLRDKPKLRAEPLSPDTYQWWFRMPDGKFESHTTRRYGFLAYVSILNKGLRKVELDTWELRVKTESGKKQRLAPLNMPEPKVRIGNQEKVYPVLGQKGEYSHGSTLTEPGCSTSGMVFYKHECYGGREWNPVTRNTKIVATFVATDILGGKCQCPIEFSEKSLEEINVIAPGIHLIFENPERN
jgi:hypothetical protein